MLRSYSLGSPLTKIKVPTAISFVSDVCFVGFFGGSAKVSAWEQITFISLS